jgi:hypothetical protein
MSFPGNTRFICRVVRFQIALSSEAGKTTGHTAHCPDCQTYYRASDALVNALRRDVTREINATPEDLALRITRAVRQSTPQSRRSRLPIAMSAFVGAAAVVALSFFIIRQNPAAQINSPKPANVTSTEQIDVGKLVDEADSLRIRFMNSVEPSAQKFATQNPLSQELNSVQADARSALGFLALNFLPTDTPQILDAQPSPTRG